MNWNELSRVWTGQSVTAWPTRELATVEREFAVRQRRMARALFWRDVREAAAGVLGAAAFAWAGWNMGPAGWPIGISVAIILGVSVFFVRERMRVRKIEPPADAPLLARLDAEIAEVGRQEKLLRNVASWYSVPLLGAAAIFMATVMAPAPIPVAIKIVAGLLALGILAGCHWFVLRLNRLAVKRFFEPRQRELEALRNNLTDMP